MSENSKTEEVITTSTTTSTTTNTTADAENVSTSQPKQDYSQRVVKDVPPPLWDYIAREEILEVKDGSLVPNVQALKKHFSKEGRLNPQDAIDILKQAANVFRQEPNLLQIVDPITVCGDIHGQYFDLVKLFDIGGSPGETKYLFLGDYVDRGYFGTEVVFLLISYKILFPKSFFMIRGNHECRHLTAYFNFKHECLYKYNQEVYDAFMDCFDCMPLCALLNGRFLCVHGGLSPDVKTIDDINQIDRFREPPSSGPMCDLLWSDPMDEEDEDCDALFSHNELRGCSYVFSYNAVNNFLKNNHLLSVIRAHEAQDEGYRLYKQGTSTKFPTVICIFSAPNYCDVYNNKGAIIRFQNNLMNIRQFNCSPHPYYLPNFMNAFNWSLPFVVEKVMDMFNVILNLCDPSEDELDEEEEIKTTQAPLIDKERADAIKMKIRSVGRLCRMYSTLREEQESIVLLKGLAGGSIPQGLLSQGPNAIRNAVLDFETAKKIDLINEKRPQTQIESKIQTVDKQIIEKMKHEPIQQPNTPVEAVDIKVDQAPPSSTSE